MLLVKGIHECMNEKCLYNQHCFPFNCMIVCSNVDRFICNQAILRIKVELTLKTFSEGSHYVYGINIRNIYIQ